MPFPVGVETVTVSAGQALTLPDGTVLQGKLLFIAPEIVTLASHDYVFGGTASATLSSGTFSIVLCATDATGMDPAGWTYKVVSQFTNAPNWQRYISLPKATPTVKLGDILIPDPVTATYATLERGIGVDVSGTPATGDVLKATSSSAATWQALGTSGIGVDVTGTPSAGQVLTATSSTTADWESAAGGGTGTTIRTATATVTNDNLSGLPSASSWTIAQTSAGTQLKCSIAAVAGDRIRVVGRFMHAGSHFLDWVLLNSSGVISQYAGSGTSSPLPEGDPALYPSLSFSYETGPPMFTVSAGHLSGGNATIALAHQGTGTGTVYAHTTYPWHLRLENIGP